MNCLVLHGTIDGSMIRQVLENHFLLNESIVQAIVRHLEKHGVILNGGHACSLDELDAGLVELLGQDAATIIVGTICRHVHV